MLLASTCTALVLALVLGVLDTSCQLQNADQAGRASVKLLGSSSLASATAQAASRYQHSPAQIRPGPKQLRRRKLLRLLAESSGGDRGGDGVAAGLKSGWLAVERPDDGASQAATEAKNADQLLQDSPPAQSSEAGQNELAKINQQQHWVLQQQLDELNVTEPAVRRRLAQLGSCRSSWTWTDLGAEIWPRWLRGAECVGGGCGWPPGLLRCGMAGGGSGGGGGGGGAERKLRLLRWQCERRHGSSSSSTSPKRNKRRNDRASPSSSTAALPSGGGGGEGERKSRSRGRRLAMRLSRSAGDLVCYWAPHEVRVPAEFHQSAVACVCGLGSAVGGGCN